MTPGSGKLRRLFLGVAATAFLAAPAFGHFPREGHTMNRAGNPDCIAPGALPSNNSANVGYYVGGGSPKKGMPPGPEQGTWGWDYSGRYFHRRICLLWNCRFQGGTGAYKAEGPHLKCGDE
jgi:hypothetical protein